jgi:hypothetical protein
MRKSRAGSNLIHCSDVPAHRSTRKTGPRHKSRSEPTNQCVLNPSSQGSRFSRLISRGDEFRHGRVYRGTWELSPTIDPHGNAMPRGNLLYVRSAVMCRKRNSGVDVHVRWLRQSAEGVGDGRSVNCRGLKNDIRDVCSARRELMHKPDAQAKGVRYCTVCISSAEIVMVV